ncbi:MAG TPA: porin [Terriglobales bacterium]|nr:porin [Terriglobales bacterium]
MSRFSRLLLLVAGTTSLILGVGAQAQSTSSSTDSAAMTERVQQLEKELADLKGEIAAMKASGTTAPATTAAPAGVPANAVLPASGGTSPDAAKGPTIGSLLGPTTLSGFVDVYYGQNFNNPDTRQNNLMFFNSATQQFNINMLELIIDKPPDAAASRLGYHIALGYGQAMNAIYGASTVGTTSADQYLKEYYFSYLAPVGKGLQFDVGKFVTPAGAEVIETKDNWNYTRSILFSYAIPYFHFGMRSKYTFNSKYALSAYFVNGWNDVIAINSGKTGGLSFAWTPNSKWSVSQNYLVGPNEPNNTTNIRQLFDTVVSYNPTKKLSLMTNYDYARGDKLSGVVPVVWWTGIAGYVKYQFNDRYAVATRYEYYDDKYNYTGIGAPGHVQEVTGTFEHPIATHLLTRLEFRQDMANNPIFLKGSNKMVDQQSTLTAGMVYIFDSKEGSK